MANIYRIYPTLWDGQGCYPAQTVYAIDRQSPSIPSACSKRPKADPACTWDSPTFQRLLPPPSTTGNCWGNTQAVTWPMLPAWMSYAISLGYSLTENTSLSQLKPYSDVYITGP
jgi:hypothetical protein